jgi:hypothetical protein
MRNSLLSFALIAGLCLPMGAIHAQDTSTVTATCKDGTAFTGTKRSGACRGHGGVQSWGAASTATSPVNAPAAQPGPATSQRATPAPAGPGQVWVNTASKVYHCPGTRWYGKTKQGSYMSEAEAHAQGCQTGPRESLHLIRGVRLRYAARPDRRGNCGTYHRTHAIIETDRFPLSSRIRMLRRIRAGRYAQA